MTELLLYMSELLQLEPVRDTGQSQYTPVFHGAESVLTDGDPRHGIQDDHVPFMTRGFCHCFCHSMQQTVFDVSAAVVIIATLSRGLSGAIETPQPLRGCMKPSQLYIYIYIGLYTWSRERREFSSARAGAMAKSKDK